VLDAAARLPQFLYERLRPANVSAPRLLGVMGYPGVEQDSRTLSDYTSSDGRSDRNATACAGHDHNPVLQGRRHQPMIAETGPACPG
jgi:hypothetical protein